jgi:hypothetical protein
MLKRMLLEAHVALEAAILTHDVSSSTIIYSEAARIATAATAEAVASVKVALTDALTDGSLASQNLRSACGVGDNVNRDAPLAVLDGARRQLLILGEPAAGEASEAAKSARAARSHLDDKGVHVDTYLEPLKEKAGLLQAELDKGTSSSKADARSARDATQVRIEIIAMRIVGKAHEVLGVAGRDSMRDEFPKTTYGQRHQDRAKPGETPPAPATAPAPEVPAPETKVA